MDIDEDTSGLHKPMSQPKQRKKPLLLSIQNLIGEVNQACHTGLAKIFQNYTFVGCVNFNLAIIQHQTDLYVCNVPMLSRQLIYQEVLHNFREFDYIKLSAPAPIKALVIMALENPSSGWTPEDGPKERAADYVADLLTNKRQMLQDYFRMTIDKDGNLLTLPQILPSYIPEIGLLATFILRLGTEVEWEEEQSCFEGLARELAEFYSLQYNEDQIEEEDEVIPEVQQKQSKPMRIDEDETMDEEAPTSTTTTTSTTTNTSTTATSPSSSKESLARVKNKRYWTVEHIFFPALRRRFQPSKSAGEDGSVVRIASLDKLYKVFERC